MKKVISLITSVIILLNTTLAYTLTVRVKGIELTATREPGNIIEVTSKIDDVVGWKVKSGGVTIEDNKFTMPENDVEIEAILKYSLTIYTPYLVRTEEKVEGQSVTITATSNGDNVFATWTAEGITLSATEIISPTLTFDMPGNDVTLTANYLTLGSYISYVPSKTTATVYGTDSGAIVADMIDYGYTSDKYEETNTEASGIEFDRAEIKITETSQRKLVNQKFAPNQVTSWRVFKVNNGNQLDIICTESVGSLVLRGEIGYTKAVYTLNRLCEDYINPIYADSARNPGYVSGSSEETLNTTQYPVTWESTYTNENSGFPYTDKYYDADMNQIQKLALYNSNNFAWFASRALTTNSSDSYFMVRCFNANMQASHLYIASKLGAELNVHCGYSYYVRPIVSLKPEVKITGGNGTLESPFTIGISQ